MGPDRRLCRRSRRFLRRPRAGPGLAIIHGLTLGVLSATAMGAALQMLSIALGIALRSARTARLAAWLFVPGTAILVAGMAVASHHLMAAGAVGAIGGLGLFTVLAIEVLWKGRAFESLSLFGLSAMAALIVTLILGLALIIDDDLGFLDDRLAVVGLHLLVAGFGFMGLLAVGFSHILIPLFALSQGVATRDSRWTFGLAMSGLIAGGIGLYLDWAPLVVAAALVGLAGTVLHLRAMQQNLGGGMRKNLGVSLFMIRLGWLFLVLSLVTGLLTALGVIDGLRLFIFFALFGWLLTFLFGVLQRILPFLGSMNATGDGVLPPRPSELAPENWLRLHAGLHCFALVLVAIGLVADAALPVRLGGIAGLLGALVYGAFAFRVWWMIHGRPPPSSSS